MKESQHIMNQASNRARKREKEVLKDFLDDKAFSKNFDDIKKSCGCQFGKPCEHSC